MFIEINEDLINFEEAVLATLAHEIVHKYLQVNGIFCGKSDLLKDYEYEIMTDIATVFLGLGKLMLNGCECERENEKLKVGYLNRNQLAFIYCLICSMRNVPNKNMISNLNSQSLSAVKYCKRYYKNYFNTKFRTVEFRKEFLKFLEDQVLIFRNNLNKIQKFLDFLEERYIYETKKFLKEKYEKLYSVEKELENIQKNFIYDPALRYLNTLQLIKWIEKKKKEISKDIVNTTQVLKTFRKFNKIV